MVKHLLSLIFISFFCSALEAQTYSLQWQIPVSSPKSMITDSAGNSYVVEGALLKKYNTASVFGWQNASIGTVPVTLKFDNAGNIIAAGTKTNSAAPLNDFFVCKIDAGGNLLWSLTLDSLNLNNNLVSFTIDGNDNIILSGNAIFSSNNHDALTFKVNPSGNVVWCRSFSMVAGSCLDNVAVVNVDSLNNVFISQSVKTSTSSAGIDSLAVIKYTTTGNFVNAKYFRGHPSLNFPLLSAKHSVFFKNKLYFYYLYGVNLPGVASAYFTLDSTLTTVNHFIVPSTGPGAYYKRVELTDVKSYNKKNILFTAGGQTVAATMTGPTVYQPLLETSTGNGYYPSYGSTMNGSNGLLLNSGDYAYNFADMTLGMLFCIVDPTCAITQTLTIKPMSFPSNLTAMLGLQTDKVSSVYILFSNAGGSFLEKYAMPAGIVELGQNDLIQVFPNPANNIFYIKNISTGTLVEIYNSVGQKISDIESNGSETEIDISNQPSGIYFVRINSDDKSLVRIIKE
jgi:hypothetical protein